MSHITDRINKPTNLRKLMTSRTRHTALALGPNSPSSSPWTDRGGQLVVRQRGILGNFHKRQNNENMSVKAESSSGPELE
ncbi:uncharacterized [Tachysurus ichikawai]